MKVLIHDDGGECGSQLSPSGHCPKCGFAPDMQSTSFVEVQPVAQGGPRGPVHRLRVGDPAPPTRPEMIGHWQKEVPKKNGRYWTATRDGIHGPIHSVAYLDGVLMYAGGTRDQFWLGWWWSEPIEEPPAPPSWGGSST